MSVGANRSREYLIHGTSVEVGISRACRRVDHSTVRQDSRFSISFYIHVVVCSVLRES